MNTNPEKIPQSRPGMEDLLYGLFLIALAVFAVPSVIAGYALVHGVTKHMIDSAIAINVLGGIAGIVIGIAAVVNLNALGSAALSR